MPVFKGRRKTILAGLNAKTVKGDKGEVYATAIMYLAAASQSLMGNVCPMAVMAGCEKACLFKAGLASVYTSVNAARVAKTQRYFANRAAFMADLVVDLEGFVAWCAKQGVKPACRLNGTSDIQWEVAHPAIRGGATFASIFEAFPEVRFYDYTKVYKRVYRDLPANYSLTLSYSEANGAYAAAILNAAKDTGANVAVVFRTKALRDQQIGSDHARYYRWHRHVIDGDATDMRFTDPSGVIVGLYAKGPAKGDTTGFVVD